MSVFIMSEKHTYQLPAASKVAVDGSKVRILELRQAGAEELDLTAPFELAEGVLVTLGEDPPTTAAQIAYSFRGVFVAIHGKLYTFEDALHRTVGGGMVEIVITDDVTIGEMMDEVVEPPYPQEIVTAIFRPGPMTIYGQGKARPLVGRRPSPVLVRLLESVE